MRKQLIPGLGGEVIAVLRLRSGGNFGDTVMAEKALWLEVWKAIQEGNLEKVISVVGSDPARLQMNTPFGTWLHMAAHVGKVDIVKWLVTSGADINAYGGIVGGRPLNMAAGHGHLDVVEYLLSCGATLDVSEPERNPLFSAIYGGHMAIVRTLLQRGIDHKIRYTGNRMKNVDALAFALERGQTAIAEVLTSLG